MIDQGKCEFEIDTVELLLTTASNTDHLTTIATFSCPDFLFIHLKGTVQAQKIIVFS